MKAQKKEHAKIKSKIHPRNKHRQRYNFSELVQSYPDLKTYVTPNKFGDDSIDFSNPEAVKALNTSLLFHFYNMTYWNIPENYLCPPIPGRADYIHNIADLLQGSNYGKIPTGEKITCLDIGTGANCIYPIIGINEYDWNFIGTDIDETAIQNATEIKDQNITLKNKIDLRFQNNSKDFFYGIIKKDELFDVSICNPPFHSSAKEAHEKALQKINNLNKTNSKKATLNFGGQSNELWCEGGEERFVKEMIRESKKFANSCFWFTSLISKQSNLKMAYKTLEKFSATEVKTIPMGQGNKTSRIIAWTFLNKEEQTSWKNNRWK